MIELLIWLIIPQEINPERIGIKNILKEKFVDYKSCDNYVENNLYYKENKMGIYYKLNTKEYQVMLTYCKPTEENK